MCKTKQTKMEEKITLNNFSLLIETSNEYKKCYKLLDEIVQQFLKFVKKPNFILEKESNSEQTDSLVFDKILFLNNFFEIKIFGNDGVMCSCYFQLILSPLFDEEEKNLEKKKNISPAMIAMKNWIANQSSEFFESKTDDWKSIIFYNFQDIIHVVYTTNESLDIRAFPRRSFITMRSYYQN